MNRINVSTRQVGKKMSKMNNKRQQSVMFNDSVLIPDEYQVDSNRHKTVFISSIPELANH